jgi:hypothetical protein
MVMQEPVQVSSDDLVYDLDVQITGIVDFGMTLDEVLGGASLPPGGTRLDISWEGAVTGILSGRISGVDYLYVRPDMRIELHIHGVITTDDNARIAFIAPGVSTLNNDGTARLCEYVTLHTCFEQYTWLNQLALRAAGLVNLSTGNISVQVYAA